MIAALRAALRDEPLPPEGLPSLARLLVFVDRVLVAQACSPKDTINHLKTLSMRLKIGAFPASRDPQAIMELP